MVEHQSPSASSIMIRRVQSPEAPEREPEVTSTALLHSSFHSVVNVVLSLLARKCVKTNQACHQDRACIHQACTPGMQKPQTGTGCVIDAKADGYRMSSCRLSDIYMRLLNNPWEVWHRQGAWHQGNSWNGQSFGPNTKLTGNNNISTMCTALSSDAACLLQEQTAIRTHKARAHLGQRRTRNCS